MARAAIVFCFLVTWIAAAEPTSSLGRQAVEVFQTARTDPTKYRVAAELFARAESLTADQQAAWAYCRLRLAAEEWNASRGDASIGQRVIQEATESLALVPHHAELQRFGRELILAAGGTPPPRESNSGWYSLDTDSFRIRYPASLTSTAKTLAAKVEDQRKMLFKKWSGPASGAWAPKCEIILHPAAADFAHATGQPVAATGHALVQFSEGKPNLRRIDLRADDTAMMVDALPRELTHIILADLFPNSAPPRWATDGMAALSMSAGTVERYLLTAKRLAARRELPAVAGFMDANVKNLTGYTVGSASLVEFLVRSQGERSWTIFLRDSQRYGLEKSLERQFGFASLKALESAWLDDLRK